jgi:hypothetical protein
MKPQGVHTYEERLLDFAYGELTSAEARLVEEHVRGCSHCTEALDGIRGVRTAMSRLPLESAPDTGLDSLLAYAQQSARRAAAGPAPASRWWRRWLVPVVSVATVSVFGVIVLRVDEQVDLRLNLEEVLAKKEATRQEFSPSAPEAAPAAEEPQAAAEEPQAAAAAEPASVQELHERFDEVARKSERKREVAVPSRKPARPARRELSSDLASAGSGGGFPEKKFSEKKFPEKKKVRAAVPDDRDSSLYDADMEESRELVVAQKSVYEPPAPAAPAQQVVPAEPPAGIANEGSLGAVAGLEEESKPAANAGGRLSPGSGAKKELRSKASRRLSALELSRQAEVARREGRRELEADLLNSALSAGASGPLRVELLSRLCSAESALGRRLPATEACRRVMKEAPGSSEALAAQRLLERVLRSTPAKASQGDALPSP